MDAELGIPQSSDIGELHPSLDHGGNAHQTPQSNITLPAPAEQALRQHTLQGPSPLTTSALQRLVRAPTLKSAFSELRRKSIIVWEDGTIPVDNPLLIWDPPAHYLDSTCIIGTAGAGFSPIILPGRRQASLSCKLRMAGRQMRDKYLPVEWDYHGRTYFVGFLESKQVWLLFQPDDPDQVENDSSSRSTALNTLRRRRFSLFWGSVLQFLPGTNVVVRDQYADCTSDEAYNVASNLLERNTDDPQLSAHTLSILQNTFEHKYETWARDAPWRAEDSFFLESTPTLVVYQYGQNQRIFNENHNEEQYEAEVSAFANEYNWPQVWLFTYAIATTVRVREASEFGASPALLETEPLYSSPDEETREEFNLADLLETIETQSCPPVFDKDGDEIQPYEPVFIGRQVDCGIVLNFDQVPTQIQAAEEDTSPPQYTTFPLGFCRGIGNCQASTHLRFYQAFVDRVNHQLQEENEDLWDPPVKRGPHQLYNEIAHKTRARDGLHDSQRGYVTAAMGGKGLRGANLVTSYSRSRQACSLQLPSQSYQEKLLLVGEYIGLRSEPTVTINVQALPEDQRHGRFIYESIMRVGCDLYTEEETWAEFCNLLVVFKPLVWPGILNWATIPISKALQSLWEEFESKPDAMETQWDQVELVCLLERLLVFAQTGNAQVIQGALSEAFGLRHSLETTGFPTFSSALDVTGSIPKIRQGYWPSRGADHQAVTVANATLRFHYNESVSQTHTAKATLGLLIQRAKISSATNAATQLAQLVGDYLVEVLLKDMRAMVIDLCSEEITDLQRTGSLAEQNHANQRQRHLDGWKKQRQPWSQGEPHKHLMLAVVYGPADDAGLTASQPGMLTVGELASRIVECMDPVTCPKTSPLFINNGAFKVLAGTVWTVALGELAFTAEELKPVMNQIVATSLMKKQVCRLPWITIRADGRLSRQAGISNWVTIQRTDPPNRQGQRLETTAMRLERQAAQVATTTEEQDNAAPWVAFSGQLSTQRRYLQRVYKPDDLDLASVIATIQDPLMKAHLTEICRDFDMRIPSHRLGLRVASLASRLLPQINLELVGDEPGGVPVMQVIQNQMTWCLSTRKDAKAGLMNRESWASTFALAWLFYLKTPPAHDILRGPPYAAFLKKIGAKLINSRLFIRLHLATIKSTSSRVLLKGGQFGQDWRCIDEREIEELAEFVDRNWKDGNVGEVVGFFLGADGLRHLQGMGAL